MEFSEHEIFWHWTPVQSGIGIVAAAPPAAASGGLGKMMVPPCIPEGIDGIAVGFPPAP